MALLLSPQAGAAASNNTQRREKGRGLLFCLGLFQNGRRPPQQKRGWFSFGALLDHPKWYHQERKTRSFPHPPRRGRGAHSGRRRCRQPGCLRGPAAARGAGERRGRGRRAEGSRGAADAAGAVRWPGAETRWGAGALALGARRDGFTFGVWRAGIGFEALKLGQWVCGRQNIAGELPQVVNALDPLIRPQVAQTIMSMVAAQGPPAPGPPAPAPSAYRPMAAASQAERSQARAPPAHEAEAPRPAQQPPKPAVQSAARPKPTQPTPARPSVRAAPAPEERPPAQRAQPSQPAQPVQPAQPARPVAAAAPADAAAETTELSLLCAVQLGDLPQVGVKTKLIAGLHRITCSACSSKFSLLCKTLRGQSSFRA